MATTHGPVDVWLDRVKDSAPIIREYAAETEEKPYFRDVHTTTQHAFASASRYESVGARILGVESDWGSFAL